MGIVIEEKNIKRTFLGFYVAKKDGDTIRYPLSYGYKIFYILGSITFLLFVLDLILQGAIFGGAYPGLVTFVCLIGLLMERAACKDLARKRPELHLAKYIKYGKDSAGNTIITEADQTSILKVYIILIIVGVGLFLASTYEDAYTNLPTSNSTRSNEQLIMETVRQTKSEMNLPQKLDEVTTLTNITAQPTAIRYHYILSGVVTSQFSNESLKKYALPSICNNVDIATFLKKNINMEYSYSVSGTTETYFFPITRKDCSF